MTYRIVFTEVAAEQLTAAMIDYEERKQGLGYEFQAAIKSVLDRLKNGPFLSSPFRTRWRRVLERRFHWAIFFTIEDDVILVVTILHQSDDPAKWPGSK